MTREELVSEKDSLELSAKIAVEARIDDLKRFVQNVIDSNGLSDYMEIDDKSFSHTIQCGLPSFIVNAVNDMSYFRIIVDFMHDVTTGTIFSCIKPRGFDYTSIYATSTKEKMFIGCIEAMTKSLDSLDNLVNSDVFKMYNDDIAAYTKAIRKIALFDDDAKAKKLKQIEDSFKEGQVIKYGRGNVYVHKVTKVTPKRVWADRLTYNNGKPKKSISKKDAALLIYNGSWNIQETSF